MSERPVGQNQADPTTVGMALRAFDRLAETLGITTAQRSALLDQSEVEYQLWLGQENPQLSSDQQERLGRFLSIAELAETLAGEPKAWLFAPNSSDVFQGHTPIVHLLQGGLRGFISTQNYLRETFGGWA
jgi:hypothetical protein